ncbi:TIGR02757 family protein [bacterium]|nr:TIGR02757 family protein [bacterium]
MTLHDKLEDLYHRFHRPEFLDRDPLGVAHRYDDPADQEVAALIAASFAFGNVTAILRTLDRILKPLGAHPAKAIADRQPADWRNAYRGFVYRWVHAKDLRVYLAWIGCALREHGSLGNLWRALDENEPNVLPTMERWVDALRSTDTGRLQPRRRVLERTGGNHSELPSGAHMLLTSPAGKSGCKRINLFLRWVCRPADGVDLGLWDVSMKRLVMPVDTHILRVSQTVLGITTRPNADLKTALEITDAFARISPDDPCRYDFALTRPGILKLTEEEFG